MTLNSCPVFAPPVGGPTQPTGWLDPTNPPLTPSRDLVGPEIASRGRMTSNQTVMLVGLLAVLGGCGASKPLCNAVSCAGCCDLSGVCQAGATPNACGQHGNSCQTCGAAGLCVLGQCSLVAGSTGGGVVSTGGGGVTATGGGGVTATGGGGGVTATGGGGGVTATGGGHVATGGGTTATGGGGGSMATGGGTTATGGGTAACLGDFSLGSTFVVGRDAYTDCSPAQAPTNCATGQFIFGPGWCKCLMSCSDYTSKPKPGEACNSVLECRRLVSTSSGNTGNYCVPPNDSAWNFCYSNATGGGGGSNTGGGSGGGGGSSCAGSGKSCSFDDDCCSSNCEIGGVCQ